MNKYLLIRSKGRWKLKKYGAKRALIDFGKRPYAGGFDSALFAAMTYAADMESLTIMNDNGTVRCVLQKEFISLYQEKK